MVERLGCQGDEGKVFESYNTIDVKSKENVARGGSDTY